MNLCIGASLADVAGRHGADAARLTGLRWRLGGAPPGANRDPARLEAPKLPTHTHTYIHPYTHIDTHGDADGEAPSPAKGG